MTTGIVTGPGIGTAIAIAVAGRVGTSDGTIVVMTGGMSVVMIVGRLPVGMTGVMIDGLLRSVTIAVMIVGRLLVGTIGVMTVGPLRSVTIGGMSVVMIVGRLLVGMTGVMTVGPPAAGRSA
ncbi:hypothetical protein NKH77_12695 [Streptomyces sp. M19]